MFARSNKNFLVSVLHHRRKFLEGLQYWFAVGTTGQTMGCHGDNCCALFFSSLSFWMKRSTSSNTGDTLLPQYVSNKVQLIQTDGQTHNGGPTCAYTVHNVQTIQTHVFHTGLCCSVLYWHCRTCCSLQSSSVLVNLTSVHHICLSH